MKHGVESELHRLRISDTRGQTIIDRRVSAPAPNVTLVRRVDETGVKMLLFDTVTTPVPTGSPLAGAAPAAL